MGYSRSGICVLLAFILVVTSSSMGWTYADPVNAVIGNRSYQLRFGREPEEGVDDKIRLQTHLAYVESYLRQKDIGHLSLPLQQKRLQLLDWLHGYWQRGIFPRNEAVQGRRPVFIDSYGNLCAVGYLIARTAGMDLVRKINAKYQYRYLWQMQDHELSAWIRASGFTLDELAMIQPAYPCETEACSARTKEENFLFGLSTFFILSNLLLLVIGLTSHKLEGPAEPSLTYLRQGLYFAGGLLGLGTIVSGITFYAKRPSEALGPGQILMGTGAILTQASFLSFHYPDFSLHPSITVSALNLSAPGLHLGYIYLEEWLWWLGIMVAQLTLGIVAGNGHPIAPYLMLACVIFGFTHSSTLAAIKDKSADAPAPQGVSIGYFPAARDLAFGVRYSLAF